MVQEKGAKIDKIRLKVALKISHGRWGKTTPKRVGEGRTSLRYAEVSGGHIGGGGKGGGICLASQKRCYFVKMQV